MILTLLAVSLNEQPLTQPIEARFDANGGTIGRADHNTMALPDPERFISRLQAEVVATGGQYTIRNVGSANPIVVGSRSLAQGDSSPLLQGDTIRIGGYLLRVGFIEAGQDEPTLAPGIQAPAREAAVMPAPVEAPAPFARPTPGVSPLAPAPWTPSRPPAPALSDSNPFADLLGPTPAPPSQDPFGDLLGKSAPAEPPLMSPAGVDPRSAALAAPAAPPRAMLPDDYDPFAAPAAPPIAAAPPPPSGDTFADLIPPAASPSVDQAFKLGGAAVDDPLARFEANLQSGPAPSGAPGISTDPLAMFQTNAGLAQPAAGPAQRDTLPAVNEAFIPPQRVSAPAAEPLPPVPPPAVTARPTEPPWTTPGPAPAAFHAGPPPVAVAAADAMAAVPIGVSSPRRGPAVPEPVQVAPPANREREVQAAPPQAAQAPMASAAGGDLWTAFCEGAGLDLPLAPEARAERMQAIGRILRNAIEGTLQLMAVRASTKHELHAAVTMIKQQSNNPLKFSPDAKAGVEHLVRPPMRGFLDGPAAMDEAMHDLVGHAIGTVAGMRAAIEGMLDRFDPAALEAQLVDGTVLDKLLKGNRRARLWDLYVEHHRRIRDEAQEDFHTLFGKAFLAAYEQQVERLQQEAARR